MHTALHACVWVGDAVLLLAAAGSITELGIWAALQTVWVLAWDLCHDPWPHEFAAVGGDARWATALGRAAPYYKYIFEECVNPVVLVALGLCCALAPLQVHAGLIPMRAALLLLVPFVGMAAVALAVNALLLRPRGLPTFFLPMHGAVDVRSPSMYIFWPLHLSMLVGCGWQVLAVLSAGSAE